jgi:hypothetical protein
MSTSRASPRRFAIAVIPPNRYGVTTIPAIVVSDHSVELNAFLCSHAEAQNNRLYVLGGGIDRAIIPAGLSGPFNIALGVGIIVEVPSEATDAEHTVEVELQDADGHTVEIQKRPGEGEPFRAQFHFTVGRQGHLEAGDSQSVAFAVNIPALPIQKPGSYAFAIGIDGTVLRRLPYRVIEQASTPNPPNEATEYVRSRVQLPRIM